MKTKILFRADGSSLIGLGHVYRSCALAQIIKERFTTAFVIKEPAKELENDMLASVDSVIPLKAGISLEEEIALLSSGVSSGDIIVLDGYHFTGAYQQALKASTIAAVICIDDIHNGRYEADAVINHIGGIHIGDYQSVASTAFFLGVAYSLVNKVFLEYKPDWKDKKDILVCLGGADPGNHTLKVVESLPMHRFDRVTVIVGSGYQYKEELEQFIRGKNIHLHQNLQPAGVAEIMSRCKYAVLSPSTVSYEYLHIGGIAYLYQIAGNQQKVKEYFLHHRLALDFEQVADEKVNEEELLRNQKLFFDGQSHTRLCKLLDGLSFIKHCSIRKANEQDTDIVFQWANDPMAREMSFSNQPIPYDTHLEWFTKKINNTASSYYIFENENKAVAQIRFDVKESEAILSYSISPAERGKSLGVWILAEGIRYLTQENSAIRTVVGFVKETNIASCKSFEKLRFKKQAATEYPASFKYYMEIK